jgi:mannitol/fructose-specific phosphotransferase system IIA component
MRLNGYRENNLMTSKTKVNSNQVSNRYLKSMFGREATINTTLEGH